MKSFEERLEELEEISQKLKQGDVPLQEAMDLFEQGIKLSTALEKELAKMERKIEILMNNPATKDDKPELQLFPELDNEQ